VDRLLNLLRGNKMTLLVALPANSLALAEAAERHGAHALKTHINMTHKASHVRFGTLDEEQDVLNAILQRVKVPVGIVPGASLDVTPALITRLAGMGMDFFDMFAHFVTPQLFEVPGISRMAAVDSSFDWATIDELTTRDVEMIEGATIPSTGYGERLSIVDLARYRMLRARVHVPLIIPSQRSLVPDDIRRLHDTGAEAVMIGVLSTGTTPEELGPQVSAFREAIEKL
jgi:hypothetical protein